MLRIQDSDEDPHKNLFSVVTFVSLLVVIAGFGLYIWYRKRYCRSCFGGTLGETTNAWQLQSGPSL